VAGNSADAGRSVTSKVIAILTTFTGGTAHSVTELARLTGMPLSTAHRLAAELVASGALERTEDGSYQVGLPLQMISSRASQTPSIRERAPRVMEDLSTAARTDVRLGVFEGLDVVYIEKLFGYHPASLFSASATVPAHATALGKAILAFSASPTVDEVIAHGLKAYTPYTLTTPDRFRRALAVTRITRIAVSHGEFAVGMSAIAAPVFAAGGRVVAALEARVRDLRTDLPVMQPALIVAARSLSRELATTSHLSRYAIAADLRCNGLTPDPVSISDPALSGSGPAG